MAKILVVDDEKRLIELIQVRLEAAGYRVITACNGEEGLEKAKNEKPDLIVLDIMMPKVDGFEVCRTLKNDPLYSHIPIILLSAMDTEEGFKTGDELKADSYIVKPFEPTILLGRIESLLKR